MIDSAKPGGWHMVRSRLRPCRRVLVGTDGVWDRGRVGATPSPVHFDSFARWCEAHAGARVAIAIDGTWLHELLCNPELPLAGSDAVLAYARQLFTHYHGGAAQQWPLAMWQSAGRVGVSALHGDALEGMKAAALRNRVRIVGVAPAWAWRLQAVAASRPEWSTAHQARLVIVNGKHITDLTCQNGGLRQVRGGWLSVPTTQALTEWLHSHPADGATLVTGHGLSGHATAGQQLDVVGNLDATTPSFVDFRTPERSRGTFWPSPDFLNRPPPAPRLAWAFAATACTVLAVAGASAWQAWRTLQDEKADLARWQATAARRPSRPGDARPHAPSLGAQSNVTAVRTAQQLARRMSYPWQDLFGAVEAAGTSELQWLSLEHRSEQSAVHLEGIAPSTASALAAADRLSTARSWREVTLQHLQIGGMEPKSVRFEINAKLLPSPTIATVLPPHAAASGEAP